MDTVTEPRRERVKDLVREMDRDQVIEVMFGMADEMDRLEESMGGFIASMCRLVRALFADRLDFYERLASAARAIEAAPKLSGRDRAELMKVTLDVLNDVVARRPEPVSEFPFEVASFIKLPWIAKHMQGSTG